MHPPKTHHLNFGQKQIIADAVVTQGAAVNAISLAEICVGEEDSENVANTIRSWGINILDIPAAAAETSAIAYRHFRQRRHSHSGKDSPATPLPDFFIGASRTNNELVASNGRLGAISNLLPICSFDYAIADKLEI